MLEREPGELKRRRVPCEQPLHMGESVLSRRKIPGLANTAVELTTPCEPKARGNPVAIREPGHGSLSWPSRERYVKVPCDRKVARRKATRPGEADRRSKSRVICSG